MRRFIDEEVIPAERDLDRGDTRSAEVMAGRQTTAKTRGRWALGHPPEIAGAGLPFFDFALVNDMDRLYFGGDRNAQDQFGYIEPGKQAVFGRSYAAEPDVLIEELKQDTAIAAADTLLLTVPNQLGVEYNAHVIEAILTHVAPGLGWR